MKNKTVFVLNHASHYRANIFKRINNDLSADFYFGNIPNSSVKRIDYSELSNFKKEFKTFKFMPFYWFCNSVHLIFKPYRNYVLTGDPYILSNWLMLILGRITNKRMYLWTHGWYGKESLFKKLLKKIYFSLANHIFLYGNYAKNLMIGEGFLETKLTPLFNSLDYEFQLTLRNKLGTDKIFFEHFKNNNPVIIFTGRMQKSKKLEMILDCISHQDKIGVKWNFIVVGKETYDFNQEITNRNLNNQVWMYGPCYEEKTISNLIYNSNVCVCPGSIGLTAIHSLMYGTPVISHDDFKNQGPEFEVIKNGKNGMFFKKDSIKDLIEKVQFVINNNFTRENCYYEVDKIWNPDNQISILKQKLG